MPNKRRQKKLLILAGEGGLPPLVVGRAAECGFDALTIALAPTVKGDYHPQLPKLPELLLSLKARGYRRVLLVGGLPRRRTTEQLLKNKRLAAFLGDKTKGDDRLLSTAVYYLRLNGFKPMPLATTILLPFLATGGAMGKHQLPTAAVTRSIAVAARALKRLSKFDVGQAAVVQGENILAIEGAEGTDKMIRRTAELAWRQGDKPILVKARKVGQSKYADLPTIGVETAKIAAAAGFGGIAIEVGRVLVIDKPRLIKRMDENGLFLWGFRRSFF